MWFGFMKGEMVAVGGVGGTQKVSDALDRRTAPEQEKKTPLPTFIVIFILINI